MPNKTAFAAFALLLGTSAAAQQPAQPPKPSIQALLNAGYELKSVVLSRAACGNQPANRALTCSRELYFFQSLRKDVLFRCETGLWNGRPTADCTRIG